jgi:hypothetical protein
MPGSLTTPGRPGACDVASGHIAFHLMHGVGTRNETLSRLNGWPMRSPVNASPKPSRAPAHDSGPMWIATPSRDLHPLLLAGLPALRTTSPLIPSIADIRAEIDLRRCGPTPDLDGSAVTIDILLPLPEWAVHQQDGTLGPNTAPKVLHCKIAQRSPLHQPLVVSRLRL